MISFHASYHQRKLYTNVHSSVLCNTYILFRPDSSLLLKNILYLFFTHLCYCYLGMCLSFHQGEFYICISHLT